MFDLAWDNRGLTVNLTDLPSWALQMFLEMRNKRIEEENMLEAQHRPVGR